MSKIAKSLTISKELIINFLQKKRGNFRFYNNPHTNNLYYAQSTGNFDKVVPLGTLDNKEIFETHIKMLESQGFG
jgi:hypothetical protein